MLCTEALFPSLAFVTQQAIARTFRQESRERQEGSRLCCKTPRASLECPCCGSKLPSINEEHRKLEEFNEAENVKQLRQQLKEAEEALFDR